MAASQFWGQKDEDIVKYLKDAYSEPNGPPTIAAQVILEYRRARRQMVVQWCMVVATIISAVLGLIAVIVAKNG